MKMRSLTMPLVLLSILVGFIVVTQAARYQEERVLVHKLMRQERELYESNALLISDIDRNTQPYMKDWKRELFKEDR